MKKFCPQKKLYPGSRYSDQQAFLSVSEVAERLNLTTRTVRRYFRIYRKKFVRPCQFRQFVEGGLAALHCRPRKRIGARKGGVK